MANMAARLNELLAEQVTLRSQEEVEHFFRGPRRAPPGIVRVPEWRPTPPKTPAGGRHMGRRRPEVTTPVTGPQAVHGAAHHRWMAGGQPGNTGENNSAR